MKHVVTVKNDTSFNAVQSVKLTCTCGWVEKCYIHQAEKTARSHILMRHTSGVVHYDGVHLEVLR